MASSEDEMADDEVVAKWEYKGKDALLHGPQCGVRGDVLHDDALEECNLLALVWHSCRATRQRCMSWCPSAMSRWSLATSMEHGTCTCFRASIPFG